MKIFINVIVILLISGFVSAQETVTIEQCWQNAYNNMPTMKQKYSLQKLDSLEQSILKTNYLPVINANAQASWQSDVVGIDIESPMINIDKPSQDQYKAFIEINQLIWDGGRTKALKNKNSIATNLENAKVESSFHDIKLRVTSLYFGLILSQKQTYLTKKLISNLSEKAREVKSSVEQGMVLESNYYVLKAEELKVKQRLTEFQKQSIAVANMLNVIADMEISVDDSLEIPQAVIVEKCNRQELNVFKIQQELLDAGKLAVEKNRMPVFNAFAQVGYGRPGLNMLKTEADSWLLTGARVSWNIFDWNINKHKRQKITCKQEIVDSQKEQFLQHIETQTKQYNSDIEKYQDLLQDDNKIIDLRQKITQAYETQLKQGAVTSSEYIEELYKEERALITKEIHNIKLIQSEIALQILLEK